MKTYSHALILYEKHLGGWVLQSVHRSLSLVRKAQGATPEFYRARILYRRDGLTREEWIQLVQERRFIANER